MLSEKMTQALNKQLNAELFSAYLYLSMSAHFSDMGMSGFATWMNVQYQEEMSHAMKFYNYILERGGKVTLAAIDAPQTEWESTQAVFEDTLKHEQLITSLINELADLAIEEKDHATGIFLHWFVTEQVEEEDNVNEVLSKLKLTSGSGNGMFILDKELGLRVYTPPTTAAE